MKRIIQLLVMLFTLPVIFAACGSGGGGGNGGGGTQATVLFQEDFSAYNIGDPLDPTKWVPLVTGQSIAGNTIQELTKALYVFTNRFILYNGGFGWTNYTFKLDLKTTNIAGAFGVYFRAQQGPISGGPSYFVQLSAGNRIVLISNVGGGGGSTMLEDITIAAPYSANQYYPLQITVNGENIKVWFNNALVIDHTDTGTTITTGSIGFQAFGDYAYYDNIMVTTP